MLRCITSLYINRAIVFRIAHMDFTQRYLGTLLGVVWALLNPLATILIIYFVFTFGLKAGIVGGQKYHLWLIPGMLSWFYISEAVLNGAAAVTDYRYLVMKINFPVEILPYVKTLAPIIPHVALMSLYLAYMFIVEKSRSVMWLQLIYYLGCANCLCLAASYLTSAFNVFARDTISLLSITIQILFWATPIFWNPSILPPHLAAWILKSPTNYIIQGYRESIFTHVGFWERPVEGLIFWGFTLGLLFLGTSIFNRTKKHFADVL